MREVIHELKTNRVLLLQSIGFFLLSLSLIVTNGLHRCEPSGCGLYIGQWHLHDALWHISLVKSAFNSFPFAHPFYSGGTVFGYNYLIDLILFSFAKFGLKPFFIFFRFLPTIISLFYIFVSIKYVQMYSKTRTELNSTIFFLFFGSSLSYLATLYADNTFFYSSMRGFPVVTSIQPGMMFLNLQFALTLPLILLTLIFFKQSTKISSAFWFALLMFSISGLKFYGGIVLTLILSGMILVRILHKDKINLRIYQLLAIIIGDVLAKSLFYSSAGASGTLFSWAPFALTHVLIDDPILFTNLSWTLARYYLYEHGGWRSLRLIALESFTVFLLAIMNFGTRLIGILSLGFTKIRQTLLLDDLVIILVIIFTFIMPVLFVQEGGWFNTMQFLYYGVFLASFYAGKVLAHLASSPQILARVLAALIVILTIPNCLEQLRYLTAPQNLIPDSELVALQKLADAEPGVVYISSPELKNAIVPALSGKIAYYLDVDQLMVTHIDYGERRQEMFNVVRKNLLSLPVKYFYLYKNEETSPELINELKDTKDAFILAETPELIIFQR